MAQALTSEQVELLRDGLYALLKHGDFDGLRIDCWRQRGVITDLIDRLRIADRVTL